jgi:Ca-activated chloride channel homolog
VSWRFANPEWLNLLLGLPVYWWAAGQLWRRRQTRLAKALGENNFKLLGSSFDQQRAAWRWRLEVLILACGLLALARPQTEGGKQKVKNQGVEVLLLVDVSRSMLAEDLRPSRLEVAKKELTRLVDLSTGDRFGLVAFAGSAVLLSPMTTDREAIKMYLESLNPDMVSSQGTDFSKALDVARGALDRGSVGDGAEDVAVTRVVLMASDGETHDEDDKVAAENLFKEKDIRVFALAFGTEKGAPVPIKDNAGQTRGYLNDSSGKTVLSQLRPQSMRELTERGKGSFYTFSFSQDAVTAVRKDLDAVQKASFSDGEVTLYNERFQIPLSIAMGLALFYLWLSERKKKGRVWRGRFEAAA